MKVLERRGHATGKSSQLIEISARTGVYIVCPTHRHARQLVALADRMGLRIKFPLTPEEVRNSRVGGSVARDGVLVDDVDAVLSQLLGVRVNEVTWNGPTS